MAQSNMSGSKAMKAIVIDGEFGLDHLKSVDRSEPKPRRGEIVIRTSAVSLNYRDTDMVAGTYPFKFPLPLVPTSDGVGERDQCCAGRASPRGTDAEKLAINSTGIDRRGLERSGQPAARADAGGSRG
jgi:hypothetical protein